MTKYKLIDFPYFQQEVGETSVFEFDKNFPIKVKRVYFITGKGKRGGHSHLEEKEVFVAVSGTVKTRVHNGRNEEEITLDAKNKALFIPNNVWHEFYEFSDDAVLACFSSTHFDSAKKDYVCDETKFLKQFPR
jgi:dTDP-4-dehydrorhamnose 3,5-epimerase-like enzyme